jgi:hypothetical protein
MKKQQTSINREDEKTNGNSNIVELPYAVKNDKKTGNEIPDELAKEIEWRDREVARVFKEGRNRGGRPTKLNELIIKDLEVLARIGLSEKAMAQSVGIDPVTLDNWMKKDEGFFNRIKRARNRGKAVLLNSIYGHGQKNWTALAWLLERQYPLEYGVRQKVELTGKEGGPITFRVSYEDRKESVKSVTG